MKSLLFSVAALVLTGCVSQIFLDDVPRADTSHIASAGTTKRVYALSTSACARSGAALPYEVHERINRKWNSRCAPIEGFTHRPGRDYALQIIEYRDGDARSRLILDTVLAQWPQDQRTEAELRSR